MKNITIKASELKNGVLLKINGMFQMVHSVKINDNNIDIVYGGMDKQTSLLKEDKIIIKTPTK